MESNNNQINENFVMDNNNNNNNNNDNTVPTVDGNINLKNGKNEKHISDENSSMKFEEVSSLNNKLNEDNENELKLSNTEENLDEFSQNNNNNNSNNNEIQNNERNISSPERNSTNYHNNNDDNNDNNSNDNINLEIDENLIDKNKIIILKMDEKGNLRKEDNKNDIDIDSSIETDNNNNNVNNSKNNNNICDNESSMNVVKPQEKEIIIDNSVYISENMNTSKEREINNSAILDSNINSNTNTNININTNDNINDNINGNINHNININTNTNTNNNKNINTNTNGSTNDNINISTSINTNDNINDNTNNDINDNNITNINDNINNTNTNIIENQEVSPSEEDNSDPCLLRSNSLPNLLPSQIYTTLSSEQNSNANTPVVSSHDLLADAKINPEVMNLSYSGLNNVSTISLSDASIATLSGPEVVEIDHLNNKPKYYHEKSKLSKTIEMTPEESQTGSDDAVRMGDTPSMEPSPQITSEKENRRNSSSSNENENLKKNKDHDRDRIDYPGYYKNPFLFLKSEIYGEDALSEKLTELKKERVQNFLAVPVELEKFLNYGILICLDSFLYIFTILPIRLIVAIKSMIKGLFVKDAFKLRHESDLLKGLLIVFCCIFMQYIDVSRLYHFIRGQNIVKLYLIYNTMEVFDKLCSAFGHDVLDSLFAENIIKKSNQGSRFPVIVHFIVALTYLTLHTIVLFYLVVSLNVSINSYNNALFSFLISNQFGEIKSSVFKRFERENLFQLTCADIVERFQILVFLVIITGRNFLELTGTGAETLSHFYTLFSKSILSPASFSSWIPKMDILQTFQSSNFPEFCEKIVNLLVTKFTNFMNSPTYQLLAVLITPVVVIYGSEIFVDYLKHTFITKFNQIKPNVYTKYRDSLCKDFAAPDHNKKKYSDNQILDRSNYVSRRIGLVTLPLACLTIRIINQTLKMFGYLYIDGDQLHSFSIHNFFHDDGTLNTKYAKLAFINFFMIFVFFFFIYICVLIFKLYLSLYIHKISYKRVQEMKKEQGNDTAAAEAHKEEMKRLVKDGPVDYHQFQRQPNDIPPQHDDKLDKIDRYMMVKSRIP